MQAMLDPKMCTSVMCSEEGRSVEPNLPFIAALCIFGEFSLDFAYEERTTNTHTT